MQQQLKWFHSAGPFPHDERFSRQIQELREPQVLFIIE
jgi:hypothetical protein